MYRWAAIIVLPLLCGLAQAVPVQPIAPNVAADRFRPLPFDNQRLAGILALRLRANNEGFLEGVDPDMLLADDLAPGLYLSAGASAYEYRSDTRLRALLDHVAAGVGKRAPPSAYLSEAGTNATAQQAALRVIRSNMLGLLSYYRVTGEESAYSAAQKMGDLLVKSSDTLKTAAPGSGASVALAEPLGFLYRYTAEPAYLNLAKSLAASSEVLSEGSDIDSLQAYAALVDLYRLTGTKRYLQAGIAGWQRVSQTASSGAGVPQSTDKDVDQLCYTGAWMRLTTMLLRVTGEAGYAEALERATYNALFSAQSARTGDICRETANGGKKLFLASSHDGAIPCTLAIAAAIAAVPEGVWGRFGNGITLNFYTGGRATVQLRRRALVQIYSEANFPQRGEVQLHVEPSHPVHFALRLRVPSWCVDYSADFGGSHLLGKPGEYLVIDREWKRGDTVQIRIGLHTRIAALPSDESRVTVQRGPQLLVLGHSLNGQITDLSKVHLKLPASGELQLRPVDNKFPSDWAGDQAYEAEGVLAGKPIPVILIPLCDALDYVASVLRE